MISQPKIIPSPRELWWRGHVQVWKTPVWQYLYAALLRLRNKRLHGFITTRDTELVIEAFPRSANTFLFHAIRLSSPRPLRIAHHLHDVIQIDRGIRFGIPIVVVMREPLSAFVSYRLKSPKISAATMEEIYTSFYAHILTHHDKILLVRYEDVIQNTDKVVAKILDLAGTSPDQREMISTDSIFSAIDAAKSDRERTGRSSATSFNTTVARPTAEKQALRNEMEAELLIARGRAFEKAQAIYAKLLPLCHAF